MNPIYKFEIYRFGSTIYQSWSTGYIDRQGNISTAIPYRHTGLFAKQSDVIQVSFASGITLAYYDANQQFMYTVGDSRNIYDWFTKIPDNVKYIAVNMPEEYFSGGSMYESAPAYIKFGSWIEAHPIYKDDCAKEYELETNQRFYRAKLSGKLSFIRDDYKFIMAQTFDTEYIVLLSKSNNMGLAWSEYWRGKFMRTDCEIDDDNQKVVVQPDVWDNYNDVIAGLEKEYNLIELAPAITSVKLTKRPLIQIYMPGDSIVSCFLGGIYWEQDANATTDRNALIRTYHFALCNLLKEINVTGSTNPNVNALYAGTMTASAENVFSGNLYSDTNNGYYVYMQQVYKAPSFGFALMEIRRSSDNVAVYRYQITLSGTTPWDNADFDAAAVDGSGATGSAHCEMATYNIYARYLLDVETIQGLNTYEIPTSDIVDYNRNYRRVIGYAIDVARISNRSSTTPTQWGRLDNGTYFYPPYSILGQEFYPIARSTWRYASIWFAFLSFDFILEEAGRKEYTLRDAYPLASCISVLLKQFAPGITHEATTEYSQFLYGATNPIGSNQTTLLLTQKSNILSGDYDRPAQKAPITLQQVTNMLRDCFRCFWYIEDNKFKVEHIQWFRNGGSYGYNQILAADLTQLTNLPNMKKWGFVTSKYTFDKVDMAERYQFKWMDDCTKGFEGYPIEVISKYVTAGKVEEVNVSNFTTDLDYMILNPGAISSDGFGLLGAQIKSGESVYSVPIININIGSTDYIMQNGLLSFLYIAPTYYVYDLPARNVRINGNTTYANGIERKKKQTLNFPLIDDPNPLQLIKTYIGNGQIDKLSINLHSRSIKATLKYDTE